jgi:Pyruvate/2-oxoacid:ferredoxin oxidoreductase delta subunit
LSKLAKKPCEKTEENYCIAAGTWAADLNAQGLGREVSQEELMGILENAEKAGLVHHTANIQGGTNIICNCCSCCCLYLKSFKESGGGIGTVARSNFKPERNTDLCAFCEECIPICPTGAIYHHYPHRKDGIDEYMMIRSELCLGCGLCASNCSNDAITLKKVRDIEPSKDYMEMVGRISEGRTH